MSDRLQTLNLNHTEALLDVVFGVIVAIPLIKLPMHIHKLLVDLSYNSIVNVLLLLSALVFSAFYWLEVRHFLKEQKRFNDALGFSRGALADGVPVPLAMFLLGSLSMMALASGILSFASAGRFKSFLTASVLYWMIDCLGTLSLKKTYKPFTAEILSKKKKSRSEYDWFSGHITSNYFYLYGIGNVVFFASLLHLDEMFNEAMIYRVTASFVIFIFTLFRHLCWRSKLYWWWMKRQRRRAQANRRSEKLRIQSQH